MDGIPTISSPGGKKNTFLLGKEKLWGSLVTIGIALVACVLLYMALPFILSFLGMAISAFGKLLVLTALGTLLAAFLFVVTNPRTHAMFRYGYAIAARKITKAMVEWAPVDMLKAYSHEFLEKKLAIFREKWTIVKAQLDKLLQLINENLEKIEEAWKEVEWLKEQSYDETNGKWTSEEDQAQFRLRSQKIEQLKASNKRLEAQHERLSMLEKILAKFQRAFQFKIDEIQQWVEIFSTEYEAMKAAAAAGQQAIEVVAGDEDKKIFDLTVETMRDDIAMFQGQVESALDIASQMTSGQDIRSGAAEKAVMGALIQLDRNADALISDSQQKKTLLQSKDFGRIANSVATDRPKSVVEPVDVRRKKYNLRRGQ